MSVNNVDKILSYVYPISVESCDRLILNESIFYRDSCQVCGKCCIHEDLIFLPFEVELMQAILSNKVVLDATEHLGNSISNIQELVDSLVPITVDVRGKEKRLYKSKLPYNTYYFADRGTLNRCHWDIPVGDGMLGCGIHQVSGLTCKFPHIRFIYNRKTKSTHIGLMQYGRNWALKCPIMFDKTFYPDTVKTVIDKFKLLQRYCEYFEIDNYCQIIIDVLSSVVVEADIKRVCGKNLLAQNSMCKRLF